MKRFIFFFLGVVLFVSCETEGGDDFLDSKSEGSKELSSSFAGKDGGGVSPGGDQSGGDIQAGQITSGEWNDLENWDFWLNLGQNQKFIDAKEIWEYNLSDRISVSLKNSLSKSLVNTQLFLLNEDSEELFSVFTDNTGKAELFINLLTNVGDKNKLKIKVGDSLFSDVKLFSVGVNNLVVDLAVTANKNIDIAFVVDATGSMSDELEYLKVELVDVINKVKSNNPESQINTSSVFYRDEGDDYVTRKFDFTSDINKTVDFIKDQSADGGGDFPEAVHSALNVALKELQWSTTSTSRILFLLLDAPPHDDNQIIDQIHKQVKLAAEKGIKIIPITASGIDKKTEFLMRYMAIATNGTYVFITNHSGIGGEHIEATVGEYEVEFLNDLMARLINKYLK